MYRLPHCQKLKHVPLGIIGFVKYFALAAAILLLAGCSKNIQNSDAVRAAVMEYLAGRASQTGLDVNQMTVEIAAVTFEKDTAHATVSIKPKSSDAGGMEIAYNLDRKGDKWVVRPGGTPHMMPQAPSENGSQALPPGHPAVGASGASDKPPASGEALPPGHPAVGNK